MLGVDPGTRIVGYGILDVPAPGRFEYVECGVLKVKQGDELDARVFELASELRAVIDEFRPTCMAIERAFHGLNSASALKLAEARGAFKLIAKERGLELREYAPAKVKRAVAGNGRATKAEIQARVGILCRLERRPSSDAADALAIAICHVQSSRLPNSAQAGGRARMGRSRRGGRGST